MATKQELLDKLDINSDNIPPVKDAAPSPDPDEGTPQQTDPNPGEPV